MSWQPNLPIPVGFDDEPEELATGAPNPYRSARFLVRWALAFAVCYAVLFTGSFRLQEEWRQLFVALVLAVNVLGTKALGGQFPGSLHKLVGVLDIAVVSLAIWMVQSATTQFFLAYLLVLALSAFAVSTAVAAGYSLLVSAIYAGLMYWELGSALLHQPEYLVRIAFMCGMGLVFGLVADESMRQKARTAIIEHRMQSVASHAKSLARDKYRLRALSEIGRLGLVGSPASGSSVLFEISKRIQKGVGVDRVSLVIFATDSDTGYVAASSDDDKVEVRTIDVSEYPELQESIAHGEIVEVHPGRPLALWNRITAYLPEAHEFRSFLVVPIKTEERMFGAFYLRDRQPERCFDDEEKAFCWAAALMTASFIRGRDLVEQLRQQSRIDGLTGLLNFQAFTEELHRILGAENARVLAPYTLAVLDMDNLKEINDRYGHIAGNRAISELGDRLRESVPNALAMCRYGGDEFVALVQGPRDEAVEQLNCMLNRLLTLEWDEPFEIRASIGVAEFPANGETAEHLVEAADQAMYLAKGKGGHRIRMAGPGASDQEIYDAVVSVQTRRIVPSALEAFKERLSALQRHAIMGLKSPVVRQSIAALAQAVESIDPHSREHSSQVAALCRGLCEELGLREDDALKIEIAGYLHDVGKIKLPPEVLTKTGALSPSERAMIERAPEEAARLLESLPGLRQVANLVRTYHERWDGTGYPRGLQGDAVPFGAQIVGICDVYNALVSPRAQRPAITPERARTIIKNETGRLWNPVIGRAFLQMLARRGAGLDASGRDVATDKPLSGRRNDRRQTA